MVTSQAPNRCSDLLPVLDTHLCTASRRSSMLLVVAGSQPAVSRAIVLLDPVSFEGTDMQFSHCWAPNGARRAVAWTSCKGRAGQGLCF